jgi:hypothetical protein
MRNSIARACVLFAVLISAPFGASGSDRRFELREGGRVILDIPEGWLAAPDYLGLPLVVLGPEVSDPAEGRPVISVTPTGKKLASLAPVELEKSQKEYQDGRRAWLAKSQGSVVDFKPLKRERWAPGIESSSIGYRYRIASREFEETAYYVVCDGELYHLKSLTRKKQGREIASQVERTLRSFRCE